MQDLNEIRITGTLFNEPEYGDTVRGGRISKFSIGVKRPDPSKAIDFLHIIAWDKGADFMEENFHNHSRISVKGAVHLDKYTAPDGKEKKFYRVIASEIADPENPDISYIAPVSSNNHAQL